MLMDMIIQMHEATRDTIYMVSDLIKNHDFVSFQERSMSNDISWIIPSHTYNMLQNVHSAVSQKPTFSKI